MTAQPTRDKTRVALTGAGVSAAALVLAAAAAAPALADNNGNHNGQTKTHTNNGQSSSNAPSSNGQTKSSSANSGQDPAGNNGTVFIHDVANDHSPHNVPHVGCTFYVDFFGFDNNQNVQVSFAGQAPTGKDQALGGGQSLTPVSNDAASGAGQDWDNEITVTADELGVQNLGDPAHQGYHVKMTVVTNQPGDHKYKVFWVQPCTTTSTSSTPSTPSTPTTPTNGPSSTGTEVGATTATQNTTTPTTANAGQSSGGATVLAAHATKPSSSSSIPTEVLGRSITRSGAAPAAAPAARSLPFTGAEIGGLAAAAAVLLGGGTALTVAGRRRRARI